MAIKEIEKFYTEMFHAEKKVADYILENPYKVTNMSMAELAEASKTSDATVLRMCRRIGYKGFYQTKVSLAVYLAQKEEKGDTAEKQTPKNVSEFFRSSFRYMVNAVKNVDNDTLMKCVELIGQADTVFITAWGNTGEIAADLAHRLTLKGVRSFSSDIPEYMVRSLNLGSEKDLLIAISHSGETTHILMTLELAKKIGIPSILITGVPVSPATELADYTLCADAEGELFQNLGGASHVIELMIVDAIFYFLKTKNEKGKHAEFLISEYRK